MNGTNRDFYGSALLWAKYPRIKRVSNQLLVVPEYRKFEEIYKL